MLPQRVKASTDTGCTFNLWSQHSSCCTDLLQTKLVSAKISYCLTVQLTFFHKQVSKCLTPAPKQAWQLLKIYLNTTESMPWSVGNFSSHTAVHFLQIMTVVPHFLFLCLLLHNFWQTFLLDTHFAKVLANEHPLFSTVHLSITITSLYATQLYRVYTKECCTFKN
jgi:hypothetical protein